MNPPEFMNLYNSAQTGQSFVDALIQKSGVTPTSRQQLIDNYQTAGRANTLRAFIETPEVQAAFLDLGFVTMLYFGFLRRDAEAGGFNFWMQKLNDTNHDYRFLIKGFIDSDEHRFIGKAKPYIFEGKCRVAGSKEVVLFITGSSLPTNIIGRRGLNLSTREEQDALHYFRQTEFL